MRGTLVPLFLHAAAILRGLAAGSHRLKSCGGGSVSLIDHVLCDPDHLVSPEQSHNINLLLTTCGDKSGHVRMKVFLVDHFTPNVPTENTKPTTITTTDALNDSDGDRSTDIDRLKELVVASNNLTTTTSSIILLVAIRDEFQMAVWRSDSMNDVLTNTAMEEARQKVNTSTDFTSAVVIVAYNLCQSVRISSSRSVRHITLTALWITFTVAFVSLLVAMAVVLIKVRCQALAKAREEAEQLRAGTQHRPIDKPSVMQDFTVVSFKSTGQVLLGSTDIAAMPAQDCSSTDNLLQD